MLVMLLLMFLLAMALVLLLLVCWAVLLAVPTWLHCWHLPAAVTKANVEANGASIPVVSGTVLC